MMIACPGSGLHGSSIMLCEHMLCGEGPDNPDGADLRHESPRTISSADDENGNGL